MYGEGKQVIGKTLGSYQIVDVLGEGGMGVVYTAQHPLIGRRAAIKVLLPELSNNTEVVERFFNEARAATLIKHAGIIDIIDFGYAEDNSAYIIMEYLDGESLTDRIERSGRVAEFDVFRFTRQAASALSAAHKAGIVHRDLKPDNIFVVPDSEVAGGERIKILDFGIAKLSPDASGGLSKTRTGAVMGSPLYMSPEQCRGAGDADARTDIYAMGCVMYHMAVGQPPFDGRGAGEVIAKHIYEQPTPPRVIVGDISEALDSIIVQCLAKKPEHRFESMRTLMKAIDSATGGQFATRSHAPSYRTPAGGVPVVTPDKLAPTVPPSPGHPSQAFRAQTPAPDAYPRPGSHLPTQPSPVPKGSTTMSGAAAQVTMDGLDRPPRSKAPLFAVLALLVVGGGGFGVYMATRGGSDGVEAAAQQTETTEQTETETGTTAAGAGAESEGTDVESGDGTVDESATPPVEKVELTITSTPSQALVRDADRRLVGETPFTTEVEKSDDEVVFFVNQAGFEESEVKLVPSEDREHNVELERVAAVADKSDRRKKKKRARDRRKVVKKTEPTTTTTKKKKKRKSGFGQTVDPLGD